MGLLGGVVGGVAGGVIGNKMDKQARQIDEAIQELEVKRVGEGIQLVLNENAVRFDTNKSSLTADAKANLEKLVPVFTEYPDTDITIFGYTDIGPADYNLKLSKERAASVRNYLVAKGIASARFHVTGFADPIASNETVDGRSQNRRVEFAITANDKMRAEAKVEAGN
jgi:outer membrane protein OmpA-like peptidoglycan-associated protein